MVNHVGNQGFNVRVNRQITLDDGAPYLPVSLGRIGDQLLGSSNGGSDMDEHVNAFIHQACRGCSAEPLPRSGDEHHAFLHKPWNALQFMKARMQLVAGCANTPLTHLFGIHELRSMQGEHHDRQTASHGFLNA